MLLSKVHHHALQIPILAVGFTAFTLSLAISISLPTPLGSSLANGSKLRIPFQDSL